MKENYRYRQHKSSPWLAPGVSAIWSKISPGRFIILSFESTANLRMRNGFKKKILLVPLVCSQQRQKQVRVKVESDKTIDTGTQAHRHTQHIQHVIDVAFRIVRQLFNTLINAQKHIDVAHHFKIRHDCVCSDRSISKIKFTNFIGQCMMFLVFQQMEQHK